MGYALEFSTPKKSNFNTLDSPHGWKCPYKRLSLERGDPLCWVAGCLYSPSSCTVLTLRRARKWRHRGSTDFLLAPPHYLFHASKSICCGFENLHFPLDTFGIRVLRYPEGGERYKDARSSSHISGFITSYCCRYVDSLWDSSKRPQSQSETKGYLSKREPICKSKLTYHHCQLRQQALTLWQCFDFAWRS